MEHSHTTIIYLKIRLSAFHFHLSHISSMAQNYYCYKKRVVRQHNSNSLLQTLYREPNTASKKENPPIGREPHCVWLRLPTTGVLDVPYIE